ncbi:hypothetical protein B0I08_104186 [Glaciihabitans tibetensis]|uniref:Uncharacterized protein n=1 Tax=Glaciihabitans tibetensis TaxID=1266600 RepID=A0A2T0VE85_9MICO|nr:hypothetical protein [Glaciihabitans tibetensis]PRY68484.1 hypothetical protein B0I08_104186 [Glaciihabitans tibetensis]
MENKQSDDLRVSFAAIDAGRAAAADRLITPAWYHPVLGLLGGGYVVAITIGNTLTMIVAIVVFLVALPLMISAYKRQTGVWIWGFGAGKASRWTYLLGALMLASAGAMFYFHDVVGIDWPAWLLGAVIVVLVILLGRQFDKAVRAQLRAASHSPALLEGE